MNGLTIRIVIAWAFLLCSVGSFANNHTIDFNATCIEVQQLIFDYKLKEANALLLREAEHHPDNVVVDYLEVVSDMLNFVTHESETNFQKFETTRAHAVDRISASADHLKGRDFLLEEVYFYSSIVKGKKGQQIAAANDVRHAYNHGTKSLEKHPDFLPAYKTIGLLNSGFGSLPSNYQKLMQWMGYETSMDKGIKSIKKFIDSDDDTPEWLVLKREAKFYLAAIHLYLKNDKQKAWTMVEEITTDYRTNLLSAFARINFADKCKKNEVIINTMAYHESHPGKESIPFLWFMMGKAKLQRLDTNAHVYLLRFIKEQSGPSYVKSCYQKLAWHSLVHEQQSDYNKYLDLCKTRGNKSLEEDEQAYKASTSGVAPNQSLLKARLLYDGGYYDKALDLIRPLQGKDFETDEEKAEYFYRKGRIYEAVGNGKLAIAFYKGCIERGKDLSLYYASYSALYIAQIYEAQKQFDMAKEYYLTATSFSANKEYKRSLEHRAKNGLERIK
jgi:tetratricopeptide (TPR) repeat protein